MFGTTLARKSYGFGVEDILKHSASGLFWIITRVTWRENVRYFSDRVFHTEHEAREAFAKARA